MNPEMAGMATYDLSHRAVLLRLLCLNVLSPVDQCFGVEIECSSSIDLAPTTLLTRCITRRRK
jgi:hypothetical protein